MKTGMLSSPIIIDYIASIFKDAILVVDPVMVATSGDVLVEDSVIAAILSVLLPATMLATPNLQEAEILTGIKINNTKDQINAGERIIEMGCKAALIKGGHGDGGSGGSGWCGVGRPMWWSDTPIPHLHVPNSAQSVMIVAAMIMVIAMVMLMKG